jgi:serine/threonine protein kinase
MPSARRYLLHEQAGDVDSACNIRQCNGLSIMLKLIEPQIGKGPDYSVEFPLEIPVLVALCVTLARLAYTDVSNGLLICNGNGVSSLGLMLTQHSRSGDPQIQELHGHALSAMRILFSLEKNRKVFRRVFPPHIFDAFIDKGQYSATHVRFFPVAGLIQELAPEKELAMRQQLVSMRIRPSTEIQRHIRGYVVEEEIGKGAFGSVFRARSHRCREDECAIKEFKIDSLPKGSGNHDQTSHEVSSEVAILKRLKHPNIVQYEDAFTEGDSVYIVTELVRGTTLLDHINAASEKRESIPESKVWDIFFEICMALLYIHKKRNIIHRDLTPSNIMLDFNGCVKIIDFGLARMIRPNESIVASVVGTLQYSCPELIQHQPYTDKADIWSLGVILYQMCCLLNPFADPNPLLSAKKIVEATYDQSKLEPQSLELRTMISRLLQPKAEDRPDIVNVLASFPPQRMVCMKLESLYITNDLLKRRESELIKKVEELQFKLAQKDQELRRACAAPSRTQIAPVTPDPFGGGFSVPFSASAPFERIRVSHACMRCLFAPYLWASFFQFSFHLSHDFRCEMSKKSTQRPACSTRCALLLHLIFVACLIVAIIILPQVHKLVAISQLPPDIRLHARVAAGRTVRMCKCLPYSPSSSHGPTSGGRAIQAPDI